ncbi:uncharacterized protein LOC117302884 isoform X1 [Asterias rubens]|uniref:uncharacterized protein LOC117302884 isoform X1 n=1 Tax=Asterias rubens TaxID=7604 RepID=UPI001454FFD7|nr:uncharacterized protein LOC117302884 isoform X1 [Asterias rubens]
MDRWLSRSFGIRYMLICLLELTFLQSVLTVLHGGLLDGFALPRPMSGCSEHWMDFTVGLKYSNLTHNTNISEEFKLGLDIIDDDKVLFEFCVQNKSAISSEGLISEPLLDWPKGQYCIYSVGRAVKKDSGKYAWSYGDCPSGFKSGVTALPFMPFVRERPVDPFSPLSLTYENMTLFHYCCSTDGNVNTTIDLGMVGPFFLMPYGQPQCQKVLNMESNLQYVEWPVDEKRRSGSHPYSDTGRRFYYCYYQPMGLGMEHDIVIATFCVAVGTPTVTMIVICLCKLRAKLTSKRKQFKRLERFQSVM